MTDAATTHPISDAAGTAETQLSAGFVERLPATAAAAPWRTRCALTVWWHRPRRETAEVLPAALRDLPIAVVLWTLVRYTETPVGPYDEIAAVVSFRGRNPVHIPFITVDSPASIVGGRANWLLPKALAGFEWDGLGATVTPVEPADPAWALETRVSRSRLGLPLIAAYQVQQVSAADGRPRRFGARMSGLAHPARVRVEGSAAGPLEALLRTGDHRGFHVDHGRFAAKPLRP